MSGKANIGYVNGEKSSKLIIVNGYGDKITIKPDKIDFVINDKPQDMDDEKIKNLYKDMIDKSHEINIKEIYDVVAEETDGLPLKDIAELYFIEGYSKDQLFPLFYALSNNSIYFKQKNDLFVPKDIEEVEDRLRQEKIAKEKEEQAIIERTESIQWLKDYFSFYYKEIEQTRPYGEPDEVKKSDKEENTTDNMEESLNQEETILFSFPPKVPDIVLNLIEPIKMFAIHGSRYERKNEAIELLREIKKKTDFKMLSSQPESAFKFMYELGLFEEDENLSILKYNIPTEFSEEVIKLSQDILPFQYNAEKQPSRLNLNRHYVFTIDDEYTMDIDDGLSIEETENGYKLYIHIADVSYYVEKDSKLDKEALSRSTTVYLPIGKISMFPERLSEDLMSLVKDKERPALTFTIDCDKDFNRIEGSENVITSSIIVKNRLSFLQAEGLIMDNEVDEDDEYQYYTKEERNKLHKDLNLLLNIAEKLRQDRLNNGAIDFNTPSIKVLVDEDKNIIIKRLETNLQSHKIVKEMMVLANNIAANFCINNDIPCIFISQPEPDNPLPFDKRENLNRKEVTEVLKRMKRSEMGTLPLKHSGLGISAYTQASSPIRRYNDLLVHRQIKSFINAKMEDEKPNPNTIKSILAYNQEEIQMVAATSEQTARETMSIERESRRYWLLKYLKGLIGEVIQAYVIRKINVNYKVMLDNTLTSAILVTSEDIEEGVMVDVKIESVRIRSDNITVKLA